MSEEKNDAAAAVPTTPPARDTVDTPAAKDTAVENGNASNGIRGKDHADIGASEKDHILQKEHTISDTPDTPEKPNKLQLEKTLNESIDLENRQAFKGDDSDGKIEWTVRKVNMGSMLLDIGANGHD
jgi:hypothetical protein